MPETCFERKENGGLGECTLVLVFWGPGKSKIKAVCCQGSTAGKDVLEEISVHGSICQNRTFGNHPLANPQLLGGTLSPCSHRQEKRSSWVVTHTVLTRNRWFSPLCLIWQDSLGGEVQGVVPDSSIPHRRYFVKDETLQKCLAAKQDAAYST